MPNFLANLFTRTSPSQSTFDDPGRTAFATFASGCFWGTDHIFLKYFPDIKTTVGYCNGNEDVKNPSYKEVCTGSTGYAEGVRIEFDPAKVSYETLVEHFYRTHDPTTLSYQGRDIGTQYRSGIFTHTPEQLEIAEEVTARIQKDHFDQKGHKIVTVIEPVRIWCDAEDYHQKYLFNNPNGYRCPTHRLHW